MVSQLYRGTGYSIPFNSDSVLLCFLRKSEWVCVLCERERESNQVEEREREQSRGWERESERSGKGGQVGQTLVAYLTVFNLSTLDYDQFSHRIQKKRAGTYLINHFPRSEKHSGTLNCGFTNFMKKVELRKKRSSGNMKLTTFFEITIKTENSDACMTMFCRCLSSWAPEKISWEIISPEKGGESAS